ncbi:MAG: cyclopropane-fatty-acyl-phospholipid synthase [Caulobacteraceae bacterium]|nr:cyclopropane-fatty-acyl-phospholipid synthase [Caulobacteraceae bacterium]
MLRRFLKRVIRHGRLRVVMDGQAPFEVGEPPSGGRPILTLRIKGRLTPLKLLLNPDLEAGEAYQDGRLVVENGTLPELLELVGRNLSERPLSRLQRLAARLSSGRTVNGRRAARRNAAHHYDLSGTLYRAFLDQDLQYSCAYFRRGTESLEEAQLNKKRHIAAKLALAPDQHVLDIGCGWGGMALFLAEAAPGVRVTGVTLSREQLDVARERAVRAGLADRVRFELCDYRDLGGRYDRIVSVGMFEHVGPTHYEAFFQAVRNRLTPTGVALVHTIGRRAGGGVNPWIARHIFPGGYIPSLAQIAEAVSATPLWITDVEVLRLHYARTLDLWRERFMSRREELARVYDEPFLRMWEFYFAACAMSFRHGDLAVFQVQLAADVDALPIARDYMMAEEQRLAAGRRRTLTVVGGVGAPAAPGSGS